MGHSDEDLLALVRELPIPSPWHRDMFVANVAKMRDRPIRLIPTTSATRDGGPCGLWLVGDDEDIIVHEAGTTDYHIDQIVCHEIGHMLLGHGRIDAECQDPQHERLEQILPDIDRKAVRTVLGRTDFRAEQERDAEMFASIIMLAAAERASKSVIRTVFLDRK